MTRVYANGEDDTASIFKNTKWYRKKLEEAAPTATESGQFSLSHSYLAVRTVVSPFTLPVYGQTGGNFPVWPDLLLPNHFFDGFER